ncbi:hypothetical protein JR316_0007065 [Psilocybe cubensis]|uniref:Uncharacterized protein n=1 Tax=Psilocybe cubensis TaxID=181762 RepID=A0ACB8GYB2_PSICU|nr:hypothetical protein JR316_0007065 [Psilocybe cubensis]KAH9480465.1 hypothetical protein JR316_0007065 [Psilocybe cubensis]
MARLTPSHAFQWGKDKEKKNTKKEERANRRMAMGEFKRRCLPNERHIKQVAECFGLTKELSIQLSIFVFRRKDETSDTNFEMRVEIQRSYSLVKAVDEVM